VLFRIDAVRYTTRSLGDILLVRPASFWLPALFFASVAAGIVAFLLLFSYSKRVEIGGVLLPQSGVTRVVATHPGVISEIRIAENEPVRSGDVVLVLQGRRAISSEGDVDGKIAALLVARRESLRNEDMQIRLQTRQRIAAIESRARNLNAAASEIDGQIGLQERRVELAEEAFERFEELERTSFISRNDLIMRQRQTGLLEQKQRLAELRRAKIDVERELGTADAEARELKIQGARNEELATRNLALVEQELTDVQARRETHVLAPSTGVATAISVQIGQAVVANQTLMAIVPARSELEAELYAPSRAVGFVRPGMHVQLRYQAYSYQRFGFARGIIKEVAQVALRPEEISPLLQGAASPGRSEPLYRIRVRIDRQSMLADGVEWPLRPGSLLEAAVLQEKRRLIEWAFDPLLTIARRN
jgi:membrane fusion protein